MSYRLSSGTPSSRDVISANHHTKTVWSAACKTQTQTRAAHTIRSVGMHTNRSIGGLLSRATVDTFKKLRVSAAPDSVRNIGAGVHRFMDNDFRPDTRVKYNTTVTDSLGAVYSGVMYLDADMMNDAETEQGPALATIAMHQLTTLRRDMPDVCNVLDRVFSSTDNNSMSTDAHSVGTNSNETTRLFATSTGEFVNNMLATKTANNVLFGTDRDISHKVSVHTVRAVSRTPVERASMCAASTLEKRYITTQSVTIEELAGPYRAYVVMSVANGTPGLQERSTAVSNDPGSNLSQNNPRQSTVHIFTGGEHYSVDVSHDYHTDTTRSLHLPVYAAMNALGDKFGGPLEVELKRVMRSAPMETILSDGGVPTVVMRDSHYPLAALVVCEPLGKCCKCECPECDCGCDEDCMGDCTEENTQECQEGNCTCEHCRGKETTPLNCMPVISVQSVDSSQPTNSTHMDTLPDAVRVALMRHWNA
jgi:hypothetical protein